MECASYLAYFGQDSGDLDTNVIEISLDCLSKDAALATGEPIQCPNCESILNSFTSVVRADQNITWKCAFCESDNAVQAEEEELPQVPELTYLLESASQVAQRNQGLDDESTIIFCIDTSGSMCISKPVQGQLNLKTNKQQELLKLLQEGDDRNIDLSVTYVSRMECVQGAIESQLKQLQTGTPSKKVGVVTFNKDVKIIGDGRSELLITGDKLNSLEALRNAVDGKHNELFQLNIEQSADLLVEKVLQIEEEGPTALGPALFLSTLLASQGGLGSKVVLCTDGLANIGVGNFETDPGSFYEDVGTFATQNGVAISVISIEGEECKLERLAALTEETGGSVLRVSPERLSEEFCNILAENVIATQVNVSVVLHKALQFRHESPQDLFWNKSRLIKKVGNATTNSSFSFEFCLKPRHQLEAEHIRVDQLESVAIQAVFTYYTLDGMRCLRTITKMQPVSHNLQAAKKAANFDILARNLNNQTNKMVQKGKLNKAMGNMHAWRGELRRMAEEEEGDNRLMLDEVEEYADEIGRNVERQMEMEMGEDLSVDEEDDYDPRIYRRKELYADRMAHIGRKKIKKKNQE